MLCRKVFGQAKTLHGHRANAHFKSTEVQCLKCWKTFTRVDKLKKHGCKLDVFDKETVCLPDSNEAAPDDVTTEIDEQPTDKGPADVFPDKAYSIDKLLTKKAV